LKERSVQIDVAAISQLAAALGFRPQQEVVGEHKLAQLKHAAVQFLQSAAFQNDARRIGRQ
jgi:hypothetical protein